MSTWNSGMLRRSHPVLLLLILSFLAPASLFTQVAPAVGIRDNTPGVHAFTNARIVLAPGKVIDNGTLVVRDGMIEAVGARVTPPSDARIWYMESMTIYPGLIESYTSVGLPDGADDRGGREGGGRTARGTQNTQPPRGERYWNSNIKAADNAAEMYLPDSKENEKLRAVGFTAAQIVPSSGLMKGATAVFHLGDKTPGEMLLKAAVAQGATFARQRGSGEAYPNSTMGAVALFRQTLFDARWHKDAMAAAARYPDEPAPEYVADLAALEGVIAGTQPVLMDVQDENDLLRAAAVAREFSLKLIVRGSGHEYARLDAVRDTRLPVILPVNFPETPSVKTPEDALGVSLSALRYWDEAPENPKRLHDAGVEFALTSALLKEPSKLLENVRTAIERGLPEDAALAALTTVPAKLLGIGKSLGTIEPGKVASFVITDGDLFAKKTNIRETWVAGERYIVKAMPDADIRGTWTALLSSAPVDSVVLKFTGEAEKPKLSVTVHGKKAKDATASFEDLRLSISFSGDSIEFSGVTRLTATWTDGSFMGTGELSDGSPVRWRAVLSEPFTEEGDSDSTSRKPKKQQAASFPLVFPPGAFGREKLPEQPARLLVRGATIWTSGPGGIIENGDMLIEKGKIVRVGRGIAAPSGAVVVDASGKHVTAGIIDAHSHTAVSGGVNETGQTTTAEVRIGDVLDPDDIAIYRELAGGTTTANVLHGSANPIGGQNAVIKLRWGVLAEGLKFKGAMPGIKFALGENPKQSNWGDNNTTRYPQTRSGVEQIIRDEFTAALDYREAWSDYRAGKSRIPPRYDIQMETLLEVLDGKRLVHAHSYRQDEILMLMRVAEDFGFRIGVFQHILEGYKVADIMAKHGAGASSFSDWWAYKFEVYDAIPYNGTLMNKAGVVVSFNSDSDELARRLNLEAAKAVKYGGTPQEKALNFVTLNPAKQLRIDNRVGSLEAGKDADFVVWSGDPLSTMSVCEQTWIDGRKYFDREEDRRLNVEVVRERAVLVQKALESEDGSSGGKRGGRSRGYGEEKEHYSCQDEFSKTEDK